MPYALFNLDDEAAQDEAQRNDPAEAARRAKARDEHPIWGRADGDALRRYLCEVNPPSLTSYEPSWRDGSRWFLSEALTSAGVEPYTAQHYATRIFGSPSSGLGLVDVTPVSVPFSANEAKRDYDAGDYVGAGVNAAGAALGALPAAKVVFGARGLAKTATPIRTYRGNVVDRSFDRTAFGTWEAVPGESTGHLPRLPSASPAERRAYTLDPRSSWQGPGGKDILYDAAGLETRPTLPAQGVYTPPGGRTEFNPAFVARPAVELAEDAYGRTISPASRRALDTVEGVRGYIDAQNASAWNKPIADSRLPGSIAHSVFTPHRGALTADEMQRALEVAQRFGYRDVVDTGQGVLMTRFGNTGPSEQLGREAAHAMRSGMPEAIREALPNSSMPKLVRVESGSVGRERLWPLGEGSGAVTRQLEGILRNPEASALFAKLDRDPRIRQIALERMERDAELAARTGSPVRADIQRARKIIAEGGFSALFEALRRGDSLPAAAIAPALGLLASGEEPRQKR